nr:unnamed protein product [Spirometra erinaceieuropaei]
MANTETSQSESEPNKEDNKKILNDYISETKERLDLKTELLEKNLAAVDKWPEESFFSKKDSTLKKNTAFVKKIRNFSESYKEALRTDFEGLNLSKYVGEVASAVTEAKIKMSDIAFMLHLCSVMYRRYAEFGGLLLDAWRKSFSQQKSEKSLNLSKLRLDLVLFADLITIGVLPDSDSVRILSSQLTQLTCGDKDSYTNIGIITSFLRVCGDDWAGLIPRKIRLLSEQLGIPVPRSTFLPNERKTKCRGLFQDYYAGARSRLLAMASETRRVLASNRAHLANRGELHAERKERAEQLIAACRKFHESVSLFSDVVDEELPLSAAALITDSEDGLDADGQLRETVEIDVVNNPIFEDEDTRLFYESLPDIKAMVPGILYKESEQSVSKPANESQPPETADTVIPTEELDVDKVEIEIAEEADRLAAEELVCPGSLLPPSSCVESSGQDREKATADDHEEEGPTNAKMLMETFLTQLPNCVNRDLIDRAAIDFCLNLNRKPNRRRLARTLLMVPRSRCDLLPFYARLVAALHPVMPDLSQDLNEMLLDEFRWHVAKKDQVNLEMKLKTVRFIGELVKFKIFPADDALSCLKRLLPNFVHHQIEMACGLLDTCGRFLYRSPQSHLRTKAYLEVMRRKKTAVHMDQRYVTMIDNSYYYCDPPKTMCQFGAIELTPLQRFLRQLLWRDLDKNSVNRILKLFRKIDWADQATFDFAVTLFTGAWQVRYQSIDWLASILSGLSVYHKDFAIAVVDNIIEDVRVGMELNDQTLAQRRLSMIKYLGLLYNYKLVDSPVIFTTLYSLITFGVSLDYMNPSPVDPPSSTMRISLVCVLLDTSGCYFARGKKRRKLTVFLIYFQRYYWSKRMHPIWIPPPIKKKAVSSKPTLPPDPAVCRTSEDQQQPETPTAADSEVTDAALLAEALPDFKQTNFPSIVEQQFEETLRQLRMNPIAQNLAQAQNLVERLEKRYEQRLLRLKALYGLATDAASAKAAKSAPGLGRTGQMETISEEAENDELKLDEDEFPLEDDNDEDDDDDDFEEDDANGQSQEPNGDICDPYHDNSENPGRAYKHKNAECAYESGDSDSGGDDAEDEEAAEEDEEDEDEAEEDDEEVEGEEEATAADSSEDELVRRGLKPKFIDCPEDSEFVAAFEKMAAEAMLSASNVSAVVPGGGTAGGAVPSEGLGMAPRSLLPDLDILNLTASRAKSQAAPNPQTVSAQHTESLLARLGSTSPKDQPSSVQPEVRENKGVVPFNLVVRKGNRPHVIPLAVPEDVQFAARFIQMEAAERAEKARMKKLVLEMHEAQKAADELEYGHWGSDAVLAHQVPTNVNRDRGVKYSHPKGAPDADAVFGTSSASINPPPFSVNRNLRR